MVPSSARATRSVALRVLPLVVVASCGSGGGDPSWLYPLWVATDARVADLDGDGRADVVTLAQLASSGSQREGRLDVLLQTTPGAFAPAEAYVVGAYPWNLAVADVDGDALPDVLAGDVDGRAAWLLLQDPAQPGRFQVPTLVANDALPYSVAIADLDGDGAPDLVVADDAVGAHRVVVRPQDPARRGAFLPAVDVALPHRASKLACGDVDADGRDDLLVWMTTNAGVAAPEGVLGLRLQEPDGTLGPITELAPATGRNTARLALGDADGDGHADVLQYLTSWDGTAPTALRVLFQSNVAGAFEDPIETEVTGVRGLEDATFADLDGDGRLDAALVGAYPEGSPSRVRDQLSVLLQSDAGAFVLAHQRQLPFAASRIAAGDLDGDGRQDLVVTGAGQCWTLSQSATEPGTFLPEQRVH